MINSVPAMWLRVLNVLVALEQVFHCEFGRHCADVMKMSC